MDEQRYLGYVLNNMATSKKKFFLIVKLNVSRHEICNSMVFKLFDQKDKSIQNGFMTRKINVRPLTSIWLP